MSLKLAILASGNGSNCKAIAAEIDKGNLDASIVLIASNNLSAPVLSFAKDNNISIWARSHKDYSCREDFDKDLAIAITNSGANTVVLAGYMRLLSPFFVKQFYGRLLNIHPSILPSFPGVSGGKDALDYGVKVAGATVHFVDVDMDTGPIIIQGVTYVSSSDTEHDLMPRIHALEHKIYSQALKWLSEDRLSIVGRKVILKPSALSSNPNFQSLLDIDKFKNDINKEQAHNFLISPALD